jgi:hypothetical protein
MPNSELQTSIAALTANVVRANDQVQQASAIVGPNDPLQCSLSACADALRLAMYCIERLGH